MVSDFARLRQSARGSLSALGDGLLEDLPHRGQVRGQVVEFALRGTDDVQRRAAADGRRSAAFLTGRRRITTEARLDLAAPCASAVNPAETEETLT